MKEKQLIINADDFGFSEDTVAATIELFNKGLLTSATMMPNMPVFDKASEYALQHPEFSFGLHLCLSDEIPVTDPKLIPSLVNSEGLLWPTRELWKRSFLQRLSKKELYLEIEAQLIGISSAGIEISHIDGHGHVHKIPQIVSVLKKLMRKYNIGAIRRTQNIYHKKTEHSFLGRTYNALLDHCLSRCGKTTQYFLMVAGVLDNSDGSWWANSIRKLSAGRTEIGVHPGYEDSWRILETKPLLSDGGRAVEANNIQLITYRDL